MKNIVKIYRISKPIHKLFLLIILLVVTNSILLQVIGLTIRESINFISSNLDNGTLKFENTLPYLAFFAGVSFLYVTLNSVTNRLGDHMAGKMRFYLTHIFYNHIFDLPKSYMDTTVSGKVLNQLNRGLFSIQGFTNSLTNFLFPTILQSILTLGLITFFSPWVGLLILGLLPIYFLLSYHSSKLWGQKETIKNEFEDKSRGRISEVLQNIKLVKSVNKEKYEVAKVDFFQNEINKVYALQSNVHHKYDFFRNLSLQIVMISIYVILFYGLTQRKVELGTFVFLIQSIASLQTLFFVMSYMLGQFQSAEANTKDFFEILSIKAEKKDNEENKTLTLSENFTLKFENLSFSYGETNVLENVDFTIKNGEKVAIVGHSGAGKTTILSLILKFYKPVGGKIYLDGKDFDTLSDFEVRDNFTLVFQDNELFSGTIYENVSYAKETATEEEVIEALKSANAYDFVKKLKDGLHTQIGEKGVKLSGGQKQRIQIARAILANKPVVMLDEATSSLDSKSEESVREALEKLTKGKMVIIIAHRFSTIQNVDKVLVIGEGRVLDSGTPKELGSRNGVYKDLLTYQVEGNKKLLNNFEIVA